MAGISEVKLEWSASAVMLISPSDELELGQPADDSKSQRRCFDRSEGSQSGGCQPTYQTNTKEVKIEEIHASEPRSSPTNGLGCWSFPGMVSRNPESALETIGP